jgi:hypothetical protein
VRDGEGIHYSDDAPHCHMNAATRAYLVGELVHLRQCELPSYAVNEDGTLERLPSPGSDRRDAIDLMLAMLRRIPLDIAHKEGTCPVK